MKSFWTVLTALLVFSFAANAFAQRRTELDHVGAYNFTVEIEGINAGFQRPIDTNGSVSVFTNADGSIEMKMSGTFSARDRAALNVWLAMAATPSPLKVQIRLLTVSKDGKVLDAVKLDGVQPSVINFGRPGQESDVTVQASTLTKKHPIGLRLGISKGWDSAWYGGKSYSDGK